MPMNEENSSERENESGDSNELPSAKCVCDQPSSCTSAVHLCRALSIQSRGVLQEYFCTGQINEDLLQYKNIPEFLSISHSINGLSHLKRACTAKLLQNLTRENVFKIYDLADSYDLQEVIKRCADEIVNNLNEVKDSSQFLALRNSQMKALVRSRCNIDKLLLRDAVYEWWQCDTVRRGEIYRYLRDKIAGKVFQSDTWSSRDGKVYLLMFSVRKSGDQTCAVVHVKNIAYEKSYTVQLKDNLDITNICASCCVQSSETDPPYVFLSGRGSKSTKFLECDVIMNKWKVCPNMKFLRTNHAMVNMNDKIFVLGGKTEERNVPEIEEYDYRKSIWSVVGDLKWNVHSPLSVVYKKKIYLFGGKNNNGEDVSAIQVFDVDHKTVKILGYLPEELSGGRTVVVGHSIYIVSEQRHCMKYCTEKNHSVVLKEMPQNRTKFGMFVKEKKIFVIGGIDENQQASEHDLVYSISENTWTRIECKGEKFQGLSGQCIVKVPTDVQFYPLC